MGANRRQIAIPARGWKYRGNGNTKRGEKSPGYVLVIGMDLPRTMNPEDLPCCLLNDSILILDPYPCTLMRENESTARDGIGRPIDIAGRKVVKISMRFTWGRSACDSPGSERIL